MAEKELKEHQMQALAFYIKHVRCADTSDPGTGKTGSACVFMYYLWSRKQSRTYWVMPKSLMSKNRRELLSFTDFKPEDVVIVDNITKRRAEELGQPAKVKDQLATDAKVFIMGFARFADCYDELKKIHPEMNAVVVDESHMGFKSDSSQRTQALYSCMYRAEWFLAMTGTLIDGRLDSAYPVIKIIEPRYYPSYRTFLHQHAIYDWNMRIVGWKYHEKVAQILKAHTFRRTFKEVYGDVKIVTHHQVCSMFEKQLEAYKEFEEFAFLELEDEDKNLEAPNQGVHTMRCSQIMAHPHTFGLGEELTGKQEAVLIHALDHVAKKSRFIVYATLQPEQERLYQILKKEGVRVGLINGTVSTAQRDRVDVAFQNGELDGIVCSPETTAVGYNWGFVNHIIFASIDYRDVNFQQAVRRAIRGKRDVPLWVTILEYEDSIDQKKFKIVNRKSSDLHKVDNSYERLELGVDKAPKKEHGHGARSGLGLGSLLGSGT